MIKSFSFRILDPLVEKAVFVSLFGRVYSKKELICSKGANCLLSKQKLLRSFFFSKKTNRMLNRPSGTQIQVKYFLFFIIRHVLQYCRSFNRQICTFWVDIDNVSFKRTHQFFTILFSSKMQIAKQAFCSIVLYKPGPLFYDLSSLIKIRSLKR